MSGKDDAKKETKTNPEQVRQQQTGQEDASDASEVGRPEDSAKDTGTTRGHNEPQAVRHSAHN